MKQNTTYKQTELGLIPEDWEVKKFEDFADKSIKWAITGGPFGSDLKSSDYTHAGVRIIQLQNIGDGKFLDDYKIYTSVEKANQLLSCNIYPGEIILSKMGDPVARACFIPEIEERFVMASDGIRLVVNEKNYNKKFVHDYINSIYFRKSAIEVSTGSTRQRIGLPILKNIKILTPPLPEQKKIADCLSTWDVAIEKQSALINALTQRKKALMQQLLTGKKRLPGFSGEWKEVKLGEVIKTFSGGTPKSTVKEYYIGDIPFIKSGEINSIQTEQFINEEAIKNSSAKKVIKGDLLYALYGATSGTVGISNLDGAINQAVLCIRTNENKFYLFYLLDHLKQNVINSFLQGGQGNLSSKIINELNVKLPSLSEQTAIAEILATADRELALQKEKLAQLQTQKKGLMQVLLTGKKRLIN
ncbi:restriction endonuclease subunit S [Amniculibacterium sp. G2-70]|uniref:restriction endonuclease subunit S n=1 Tax=Amniculibacterium sp. G2-70 TaxID=2767188 RepID=UPI0016542A51|nr:restriction endonuclease subunit S [Amniculibacterium sp. G2-70]